MTRDCLAHIIQLREKGRAEQDQSVLEEARTRLLELVVAYPDDAEVNFQAAVGRVGSGSWPPSGPAPLPFPSPQNIS